MLVLDNPQVYWTDEENDSNDDKKQSKQAFKVLWFRSVLSQIYTFEADSAEVKDNYHAKSCDNLVMQTIFMIYW